jgi:hypothetical protein
MSNITNEEIELLKQASKTSKEDDWSEVCNQIKRNHFGQYPDNWYEVVIKGGIISKAASKINISSIKGEQGNEGVDKFK